MSEIKITNRFIGNNHPVYIIAEIGINHQGDIDIAKKLILEAKDCGADCVKFQKRTIDRILTKEGLNMPYVNNNSFGNTYGEHKIALELSEKDYLTLFEFSNKHNIDFAASGWDEESIDFLDDLGVPFFKMASADITNFPLLEHAAKKNKPLIISTGMSDMNTVEKAVALISKINSQIGILQCTSTYPTSFDQIHLNVITTFNEKFSDCVIGYSGHELGIAVPIASVSLGAKIIERHFTLDRTMKGGDHAASLEPQGFKKMVRDIRNIEQAMGGYDKQMQDSEAPIFKKLAKSIVSATDIAKGETITLENITTKGPGTGISPMKINELIGKTANVTIPVDTVILEENIDW